MKLIGDAHNVKIWFTITVETMVVVSGAPLHLLIQEIFVPNLKNQSRGILDIIYDYFILWYNVVMLMKKYKFILILLCITLQSLTIEGLANAWKT